jgi:2-phospho-L-lactate/phosphoenolpyruvate guanylyltransferase
MILVPVKDMSSAKQRLASVLTQQQRTTLARTMLKDICAALAQVVAPPLVAPPLSRVGFARQGGDFPRPAVALVTNDAFAVSLARHYSFEIIVDNENLGESEAIAMATAEAEKRGAAFTMVLPGDIPLLRASEVEAVLAAMPQQGSVLVPAADARGTNAVLRRPCSLFPLRFGNDSFLPHQASARATGQTCIVLDNADLPGIALDIDRPADLAQLLGFPMRTRTQKLLCEWKLPERWRGTASA